MDNKQMIMETLKERVDRNITDIVIHCTATKIGAVVNVDVVDKWHKERGFKKQPLSGRYCGYHYLILEDGTIQQGRLLSEIGAHVSGQNERSIGICYAGGLNDRGKGCDTRTEEQKESMAWLLILLKSKFKKAGIKGHRDYSPDLNGDGIISSNEWIKECPCFDATKEYENLNT